MADVSVESPARPSVDLRDAFFDTLHDLATADARVMLLTDDQGAMSLGRFRADLPERYVNAGIAEQNLIAVAAGLALAGKIPVVYGMAAFMTLRCLEQIKVDLCGMGLATVIVGSGPAYAYSHEGPTHHAAQDLAVMRGLPGMTILSPADAVSTAAAARMAVGQGGPTYVRLEKGTVPDLYADGDDFGAGFAVLRAGTDPVVIATGTMVHRALALADTLEARGLDVGVVDLYRVKPIDAAALSRVLGRARHVVTLEETSIVGGIGTAVAEILVDAGMTVPLKRFGAPDAVVYAYGPRAWLDARFGLDPETVAAAICAWRRESDRRKW